MKGKIELAMTLVGILSMLITGSIETIPLFFFGVSFIVFATGGVLLLKATGENGTEKGAVR